MTFSTGSVSIDAGFFNGGGEVLKVIRSMKELPFGHLMAVYAESNAEAGRQRWPEETPERGIDLAEQDFYEYLRQSFFRIPGAVYCLWLVEGACVSALRLEPWKDGLLLTGLETAPDRRNRGYACALIRGVQAHLGQQGSVKLYSHIHKRNTASIHTHEKCGFRKISDMAVYIDGSANSQGATYLYEA